MKELDLTDAFIAAVPFRFGSRVRAFRRQIVNAMVEKGGRNFAARAGVKGQADVYCLVQGGLHIEVELKRRFDLIQNLVEIVKGYARYESDTFKQVAALRTQARPFGDAAAANSESAANAGAAERAKCLGNRDM